jgi:hypothetical protein
MSIRLGVSGSGYPTVVDRSTGERCYVHRLAAVAELGVEAVDEAADVHHVDGVAWNNDRENLQPLPYPYHRRETLNGTL